jgi:16S rRNA (cytosine1402-N4)-methyltransferase
VARFFQEGLDAGIYSEISTEPIRPLPKEIYDNPRAKSTVLRWAVRAA